MHQWSCEWQHFNSCKRGLYLTLWCEFKFHRPESMQFIFRLLASLFWTNTTHSGHCATWCPSSPVSPPPCTAPGSSWWARHHASRASWRWQLPSAGKPLTDAPSTDSMVRLKKRDKHYESITFTGMPILVCHQFQGPKIPISQSCMNKRKTAQVSDEE